MADIASEANLLPDENVLEGASKLFLYLWKAAWKEAPATVAGDADALHDMRVAVRRLRSALQNLEGSKYEPLLSRGLRREFATERRDLSKLGDALGAVRDFDVLDEYLRDYSKEKLGKKIGEAPGLSAFQRHLQNRRAEAFAPMVKKINKAREEGALKERIARWALGLPAASGPKMTLSDAAHRILPIRLEEVAFYSEVLDDAANVEGHHELRKALKRLRYTLEFFAPCWTQEAKPFIKTITGLQDLLGEMNDRAVLREVAHEAFGIAPAEPGAGVQSDSGLQASAISAPADVLQFLKHGEHRKRYLLGRVRAQWNDLQVNGFFENLKAL